MPGMMDKSIEFLGKNRTNGTKSPSSASNGHYSEESGGSDDEHGGSLGLCVSVSAASAPAIASALLVTDVGMRVGADFQARIPDYEPGATKYTDKDNGGMLHGNQGKHRVTKRGPALSYPMFTLVTGIVGRWRAVCVTALQRPNSDAAAIRIVVAKCVTATIVWNNFTDANTFGHDCNLDEYIAVAKEKHGYNVEQALGMLFWHKHNIEKSLADLPNFTPFPDEWTVEDKVLFEQAFSFHGKSFHRIQQMLPDKTIASLVKYYYSWKKTRSRTSLMDRQARKLASKNNPGERYKDTDPPNIRDHGLQMKKSRDEDYATLKSHASAMTVTLQRESLTQGQDDPGTSTSRGRQCRSLQSLTREGFLPSSPSRGRLSDTQDSEGICDSDSDKETEGSLIPIPPINTALVEDLMSSIHRVLDISDPPPEAPEHKISFEGPLKPPKVFSKHPEFKAILKKQLSQPEEKFANRKYLEARFPFPQKDTKE
ncbi:unnamed protein product [Ranitomeya imitator]|uniref:Uncharacterized protein n=1 Tax=Ranitomeya imitator TaxID=111125 RepID=A0ABN9MM90_9NEOB|nr:unnamed protein product [Ranitomeya imitator]